MAYSAALERPLAAPALPVIGWRSLAPWLVFASFLVAALYLVAVDQGATTLLPGSAAHEFLHDARHLLGVPCH